MSAIAGEYAFHDTYEPSEQYSTNFGRVCIKLERGASAPRTCRRLSAYRGL